MKPLVAFVIWSIATAALPMHTVSTQSVQIGDVIQYRVMVPPNTGTINPPDLSPFEVINTAYQSTQTANILTMTLQVFDVDIRQIPTLSIQQNGKQYVLPPIPMQFVSGVPSTMQMPNDIAPILSIKRLPWEWMIGSGILLCMVGGLWWYYQRRKRVAFEPLPSKKPPIDVAQDALRELLRASPSSELAIKERYFKLTEILCRFLTDQFQMNAMDSTTAELKRLLSTANQISAKNRLTIIAQCEALDRYKFYDKAPMVPSELIQMIQSVQMCVQDLHDH